MLAPAKDIPMAQVSATDVPEVEAAPVRSARDWVDGFKEGWRAPRGADAFIAHFRDMLADDIRLIQPQLGATVGRRAFEDQFVRPLFELLPDLHADVERWAVNGDEIFLEITLRATLGP